MEYYALINDQQTGPYTKNQLTAMWKSGAVTGNTFVWFSGIKNWIPLSSIENDLQAEIRPRQNYKKNITNLKAALGLCGSGMLAVGVFCPIASMPFAGEIYFFHNGDGDGRIILALAVMSGILCFIRRFPLLWVTGLGSAGVLAMFYFGFQRGKGSFSSGLAGNPFSGLATLATNAMQIQWGFAILAIGAILVLVAAGLPETK